MDFDLNTNQKAAILFMTLPPELSAQLFYELGPEGVQAVTITITQLPVITPEARASVIDEFLRKSDMQEITVGGQRARIELEPAECAQALQELGLESALVEQVVLVLLQASCGGSSQNLDRFEALAKACPREISEILSREYLVTPPPAPRLRAHGPLVGPREEAAILLSSLSPFVCDAIAPWFTPEQAHEARRAIAELPFIDPEARRDVILRFLHGCGQIRMTPDELETYVATHPQSSASHLGWQLCPPLYPPYKPGRRAPGLLRAWLDRLLGRG